MRSWCAVYVDVGYLLASAATRVTGSSLRSSVEVDYPALVAALIRQVEADSGLPVLRLNWYDSGARPGGQPDHHQDQIGLLPQVKLRLGRLSYAGEQKGVDVRLGLDLALQGRSRVAEVVYLVSGDDDLTEAVEEAQGAGVQVRLLCVPGANGLSHAVSKHLRRAVDSELLVDVGTIDTCVRSRALASGLVPATGPDGDVGAPEVGVPVPVPSTSDDDELDETATGPEVPEAPATPVDPDSGAEPVPEGEPDGIPGSSPSPSIFGRKRATELVLPPPPGWAANAGSEVGVALFDAVAYAVVSSWCRTGTPEALAELRASRPAIPGELDRALLLDLSSRSGGDDIDDTGRHQVRDRFWHHVGRIRLS